jgi:hypothetical protein
MRMRPNSRSRGQVIPFMTAALSVMVLVMVFFINTFGFTTMVARAEEGAGHQAGLAALQQLDHSAGLARWEIDPVAATKTAREYVSYNLVGMTEGSPTSHGNYYGFIDASSITHGGDLDAMLQSVSGTADETGGSLDMVDGLDVEVIVPAQASGQVSEHYLNCDPAASSCASVQANPLPICDSTGNIPAQYPQAVGSALTGGCYTHSAVILRLRLHAFQLGGSTLIERVIVTQAGTDV